MARLKPAILAIKTQLAILVGEDGAPLFKRIRIWNNQVEYEKDGQLYDYPKPAAFIEIVNDAIYEQLGMGIQQADLVCRVHIVHEQYDAGQDAFEEDLVVFDLRDAVCEPYQNGGLSLFQPPGFGPLTKATEAQDYEHDNLYHYTVDFVANFIDSAGSVLDPGNGLVINKEPPTDVQIDVQLVDSIPGVDPNLFIKKKLPPQNMVAYQFPKPTK